MTFHAGAHTLALLCTAAARSKSKATKAFKFSVLLLDSASAIEALGLAVPNRQILFQFVPSTLSKGLVALK